MLHFTPEPTELHRSRLDAVMNELLSSGARTVMDLGCGDGALLERLARQARFSKIVGIDRSIIALSTAEKALASDIAGGRAALMHAPFSQRQAGLEGFDAAAMVEAIEHLDPRELSALEHLLFRRYCPAMVLITTPNREYNPLYGLAPGALRHPEHRFEWTRAKFRAWAQGVAARNRYAARFQGVGAVDAALGAPSQMAVFTRSPAPG